MSGSKSKRGGEAAKAAATNNTGRVAVVGPVNSSDSYVGHQRTMLLRSASQLLTIRRVLATLLAHSRYVTVRFWRDGIESEARCPAVPAGTFD
jgi:hypothetical protein